MQKIIALPTKVTHESIGQNASRFEIFGCYPGYGSTLGNALRRVLLSSLNGAAISAIKINGVTHEFSTIDYVAEDVVQIILNLKKVRFKMHTDGPIHLTLKAKGETVVTAADISTNADIEVVNLDQEIAHLTDKRASIVMEIEITKGVGYVPVDQQVHEERELGMIYVASIYTPIRRVNYVVENMRVGKRTDYDKVKIEVITDGSITPEEAFQKSVAILIEQFSSLNSLSDPEVLEDTVEEVEIEKEEDPKKEELHFEDIVIEELSNLSTRTLNVLQANKIKTVGDIAKLNVDDLKSLDGMGDVGVKEVKKAIGEFGITLHSL